MLLIVTNVRVLQLIVVCYGLEFLWRKCGALIGLFGFGPEYEVVSDYF